MPQLDILIITSQSLFLILFILGYVFFTKNVLPMISFRLKMKKLLEIEYLGWLEGHLYKTTMNDKSSLSLLKAMSAIQKHSIKLSQNKYITYGYTYRFDLLHLRKNYREMYEDRKY